MAALATLIGRLNNENHLYSICFLLLNVLFLALANEMCQRVRLVWGIATKYPVKFAALAPVCGGIRIPRAVRPADAAALPEATTDVYAEAAKMIGSTPVWIFHGGADKVVPTEESQRMNEALKAASGKVRDTEDENAGHNSWDKAYGKPELMKWLLSQKLTASSAKR